MVVACQEIALTEDRLDGGVFVPWSGSLETLPPHVPTQGKHELKLDLPSWNWYARARRSASPNQQEVRMRMRMMPPKSPKIQRSIGNSLAIHPKFIPNLLALHLPRSPRNDGAEEIKALFAVGDLIPLVATTRNNINKGKGTKIRGQENSIGTWRV